MLNRWMFLLSFAGLLISGFLAYEYSLASSIVCPIGGGCDTVRNSGYSSFLGISIPYLGVLFYLAVSTLTIILIQKDLKIIKKLLLLITFSGFIFSVYLTYLEEFVINAYCFWCVLSAIISTAIFILACKIYKQKNVEHTQN